MQSHSAFRAALAIGAIGAALLGAAPASDASPSFGPGPAQTATCARNPTDCARAIGARDDAYSASAKQYPNLSGVDDERDAARHCIWQALTVKRTNLRFAEELGNAHEKDGGDNDRGATWMDQHNNRSGRGVGNVMRGNSDAEITNTCFTYARANDSTLIVVKPRLR